MKPVCQTMQSSNHAANVDGIICSGIEICSAHPARRGFSPQSRPERTKGRFHLHPLARLLLRKCTHKSTRPRDSPVNARLHPLAASRYQRERPTSPGTIIPSLPPLRPLMGAVRRLRRGPSRPVRLALITVVLNVAQPPASHAAPPG